MCSEQRMALTPWYGQRGPLAFKTPRALLDKAEGRKPVSRAGKAGHVHGALPLQAP